MGKLKESDFYYGAVLSTLLNNKITPAIIESGEDRQVFDFTTDQKEFKLIVKFRSIEVATKKKDYHSWQFNIKNDIEDLRNAIQSPRKLSLGLVCGNKDNLNQSEYVVLHKDEIIKLLDIGKESISISRKKNERAYRISIGGGRENAMQIKANRLF